MFLKKLEIQGFKSFANKIVLEFPEKAKNTRGITAVVGPNGSGKSNTADAIRWALGEQSIKMLRGKKSEDVIFTGSDKKARMGFAEVSLFLDNHDKSADIDYEELIITRRVYRNGDSGYLINNAKARLADIQLLLAKANFGQRSYSIIGQGMADSVLSASLQERKELFDEAVGVRQLQIKREQALNKFKATRDNLAQTAVTLSEIEPRIRSLTRQVKKLEKREEFEKELKVIQLDYFAQIWQRLEKNQKDIEIKKNELDKTASSLSEKIQIIESKINESSAESSRQVLFEKIQNEYNNLILQKNSLLRDQTILKAKLDVEFEKQGQGNVVWLKNRVEEIQNQITNHKQQLSEIEDLIKKEQTNLKNKENNFESINKRLENVRTELNQIKGSDSQPFEGEKELEAIFELQQDLVNKLLKVENIEELKELKNQAREVSQKLSVYLEKLKSVKKQGADNLFNLQNQLEALSKEKNDLSLEISQFKLNLNIKNEKITSLNQEITKLNSEIEKINQEISLSQVKNDKKEFTSQVEKQIKEAETKISDLDKKISEQAAKISDFNKDEQGKKEKLIELQKEFQEKLNQLSQLNQKISQFDIELAKYSTRKEDIESEIRQEKLELATISKHRAEKELDENAASEQIQYLKRQMEIIGGIDEETQKEYTEIKERYDFLKTQSEDLEKAISSAEKIIEELDRTIKEQFDKAFKEINKEFQKYFRVLFNGGQAELIKVSVDEIKKEEKEEKEGEEGKEGAEEESGVLAQAEKFVEKLKQKEKESYAGIEIKAVPPGKKVKSINMLSGGERALTSIALISAIIANNPSPFVVLDEVDAALDEANSERFSYIIEELAQKTQFIVITHNRVTMHKADVLYGVTMGDDGVSKLLSIKLADAEDMVGSVRG
ncbi:MAG: AAA family ATPase [Patescibacteria group bacterium]|nr:AAA family ATPase [Patescibacteria group bacterium]